MTPPFKKTTPSADRVRVNYLLKILPITLILASTLAHPQTSNDVFGPELLCQNILNDAQMPLYGGKDLVEHEEIIRSNNVDYVVVLFFTYWGVYKKSIPYETVADDDNEFCFNGMKSPTGAPKSITYSYGRVAKAILKDGSTCGYDKIPAWVPTSLIAQDTKSRDRYHTILDKEFEETIPSLFNNWKLEQDNWKNWKADDISPDVSSVNAAGMIEALRGCKRAFSGEGFDKLRGLLDQEIDKFLKPLGVPPITPSNPRPAPAQKQT